VSPATKSREVIAGEGANDSYLTSNYDRLEPEFALARELVVARAKARLSQAQVARRMGTSQSAVARMESGHKMPSTASLQKYARAVGRELLIALR